MLCDGLDVLYLNIGRSTTSNSYTALECEAFLDHAVFSMTSVYFYNPYMASS